MFEKKLACNSKIFQSSNSSNAFRSNRKCGNILYFRTPQKSLGFEVCVDGTSREVYTLHCIGCKKSFNILQPSQLFWTFTNFTANCSCFRILEICKHANFTFTLQLVCKQTFHTKVLITFHHFQSFLSEFPRIK